ncbi:hypothetical protein MMC25_006130 [Agyrium rufum]|nr:hypothetical protein [Agyrium rufum]
MGKLRVTIKSPQVVLSDFLLHHGAGPSHCSGSRGFTGVRAPSFRPFSSATRSPSAKRTLPSPSVNRSESRRSNGESHHISNTSENQPRIDEKQLSDIRNRALSSIKGVPVPSEATVTATLEQLEQLTRLFPQGPVSNTRTPPPQKTPASSLFSLDDHPSSGTASKSPIETITQTADEIITYPSVFISPKALDSYIKIMIAAGRPSAIRNAIRLYISKPIPEPGTSNPVKYHESNPNKITAAVPLNTANAALSAAINARDLPLCLDIIKDTVCRSSFKRSKVIRRLSIPFAGLALTPLAAYTVATQLSTQFSGMTPEMATQLWTVGIIAYVGFTATIGVVAVTTSNDQMERVTWADGTALRNRWLREEERAMLDRVAVAWGFKNKAKRGEEDGAEWEALREWIGLRGMMLDRVSLMEGMQ